MKIAAFDGTATFERGEIRRSLDRAQFLRTPIGRSAEGSLVNQDWWHYAIDPEDGVKGTVIFKGDVIDMILISMSLPGDQSAEWTVERELTRKARHDQWLRDELGEPPHDFAWGHVASEFDQKGLASEIIIAYEH